MDLRFIPGRTMIVCGPSGCGKTLFTVKLLTIRHEAFKVPMRKVWWLHALDEQGETEKEIKKLKDVQFIRGFQEGWDTLPQRYDVLVIDDLFVEAGKQKELTNLFTRTARHREIFVIFLTQNLYYQGGRTRNINTHYLVLFKNPRDNVAISVLARQIGFPDLSLAFEDATLDMPYGYLFFDFTQTCPDEVRVRANLFDPLIIVYKPIRNNDNNNNEKKR